MKKVFFIGICGVSMSALAVLLKRQGISVCGCDKSYDVLPKCLKDENIMVFSEDELYEICDCDMVVFSSAIKRDHAALILAREKRKKIISRGELLGIVAGGYEKVIAVAGSHGKSTTTAMIFHCLEAAGKNPTLHLGAMLAESKTNVVCGEKEFFVCEACEYHDNFLHLYPYISVTTNIEKEHLDYFKTFEREKASFERFKSQSKIVVDRCEYSAKNIRVNKWGGVSFSIYGIDEKICKIDLKVGGFYNAKNALFAFQACKELGIKNEIIKRGLESFLGIQKRLDRKVCFGKGVIVDYAHHPTEIKNCFNFLKKLPQKKRLVFQPHTYSRTKDFLKEFVKVLSCFDEVYLYKTFPAREKPKDGLSASQLCDAVKSSGKNAQYIEDVSCVQKLISNQRNDEITIIMGAGDLPEKLNIY